MVASSLAPSPRAHPMRVWGFQEQYVSFQGFCSSMPFGHSCYALRATPSPELVPCPLAKPSAAQLASWSELQSALLKTLLCQRGRGKGRGRERP